MIDRDKIRQSPTPTFLFDVRAKEELFASTERKPESPAAAIACSRAIAQRVRRNINFASGRSIIHLVVVGLMRNS